MPDDWHAKRREYAERARDFHGFNKPPIPPLEVVDRRFFCRTAIREFDCPECAAPKNKRCRRITSAGNKRGVRYVGTPDPHEGRIAKAQLMYG